MLCFSDFYTYMYFLEPLDTVEEEIEEEAGLESTNSPILNFCFFFK